MFNEDDFDLKSIIEENGGPSKTRIYIYATLIQAIINHNLPGPF